MWLLNITFRDYIFSTRGRDGLAETASDISRIFEWRLKRGVHSPLILILRRCLHANPFEYGFPKLLLELAPVLLIVLLLDAAQAT